MYCLYYGLSPILTYRFIIPAIMGQVLGIVYRGVATRLIKKAGQRHKTAGTGAVTLIQRFGSAVNLNIHYHVLFLDGVYLDSANGTATFSFG